MSTVAEVNESRPKHGARRKLGTAAEVASICDLPESTVYEMARQDRIGGVVRLGRKLRFDMDKLEAWIDAGGQALPGGWRQEAA